jgi:hypothetical protein
MPDPVIVAQRRAMAVEQALEDTYENAVALGLPTSRIKDIKAEPLLTPEEALPVLVAELSSALAAERRMRQELGHAFGELLERVEAMQKAEPAEEAGAKK